MNGLAKSGGVRVMTAVILALSAGQALGDERFEVTVTNLTRGQSFTPILVATHEPGVKLFTLGQAATEELAILAEAGDVGALSASLTAMSQVFDVAQSGGPLGPGASAQILVNARGAADHVSVAAMLIPTNDGFFAVNGEAGPRGSGDVVTFLSPAYDAGSEANDEDCDGAIPGPPGVCGGAAVSPSASTDEGYVHIHAGIHGLGGELDPAVFDWRNPVALVRVRRIGGAP
jgi:hypothetical protein